MALNDDAYDAYTINFLKRSLIVKKVERFFSGFITCFGRKNAFCDSHIRLCLPCVKLRLLLRYGKLPCCVEVNTKNGTYHFYYLREVGFCDLAFYASNRMAESWKRGVQWDAILSKYVPS